METQYTYDPFGATTVTGATTSNSLDYTGRESDLPGLKYYRARYYDPRLHRFIAEDPMGHAAGDVNAYVYVRNNPSSYVDPFGYGAMDRAADWLIPKILRFPRFPMLFFVPLTFVEVLEKGACVIPKRAVQAVAGYYGGQLGSAWGFTAGFALGEAVMPFGGGVPGGVAGWVVGGSVGMAAASWGTGVLIDAITPEGVCPMPKAEGSKSSQ